MHVLELRAHEWTPLGELEMMNYEKEIIKIDKAPLKIQNLTTGIIKILEADNLEAARNLNVGFFIPEKGIFETAGTKPTFIYAYNSGKIIYTIDPRG